MGETKNDFGFGGWGCAFPDPSLAYDGRIGFAIFPRYLSPDPLLQGVYEHCNGDPKVSRKVVNKIIGPEIKIN